MQSTRTRIVLTLAWIMFVGLLVAVALQDYWRSGGRHWWEPVLWETSSGVTGALLMLLQRRATRRFDTLLDAPARWFAIQALCLPLFAAAFVPIAFGIRHAVYALAGATYRHDGWLDVFRYESIKISVFFSLFTVIFFGILSYYRMLEERLRLEHANALLAQAQLTRLSQQMQPHFLFNALNTISSLMHQDINKADATLMQLSEVLRATLEVSELQQAPLATELRLVRGYAHVMGERFADRVEIDWQIDPQVMGCVVPVMSLQPLLENVFKHTVERVRQRTRIAISAARSGAELVLTVRDDQGRLAVSATPGIGLRNLRERLAMLHGAGASLNLSQLEPAGVSATMRLPWPC